MKARARLDAPSERGQTHRCGIPPEGVSVRSKLTHYLPPALGASPRKLHHTHREGERERENNKGARGSILLCSTRSPLLSARLSERAERRFALLVNLRLPHYTSISPVFHHRQRERQAAVQLYWHRKEKLITLVCRKRVARSLALLCTAYNEKSTLPGSREIRNAQHAIVRCNVWGPHLSQKRTFRIYTGRQNRLDEIAFIL